jgi:hypothetical protein
MEYTKQQLLSFAFDRHGYGLVIGYNAGGFAGAWDLRSLADVARLPANLVYVWRS